MLCEPDILERVAEYFWPRVECTQTWRPRTGGVPSGDAERKYFTLCIRHKKIIVHDACGGSLNIGGIRNIKGSSHQILITEQAPCPHVSRRNKQNICRTGDDRDDAILAEIWPRSDITDSFITPIRASAQRRGNENRGSDIIIVLSRNLGYKYKVKDLLDSKDQWLKSNQIPTWN